MTTSTSCMAMHDHGYICTKPPGHTGEHGAFMPDGTAIATWTDHGAITTSPAPPVAAPTAPATAPDAEPYFDQDGNLIRSKASPDGRIVLSKKAAGTVTFGTYCELDRMTDTGTVLQTARLLAVLAADGKGWLITRQVKRHDASSAKWTVNHFAIGPDEDALEKLGELIAGSSTRCKELRGEPIMVQMTTADVEALGKLEAPVTRYAAQARYEKLYGVGA